MITDFSMFESNSSGRFLTGTAAEDWCREMKIEGFTVNGDGVVDVDGSFSISFSYGEMDVLPIRLGNVTKTFSITAKLGRQQLMKELADKRSGAAHAASDHTRRRRGLVSTDGFPVHVGGNFFLHSHELHDMTGPTETVGSICSIGNNKLRSLRGLPTGFVALMCPRNELTDLRDGPNKYMDTYTCDGNLLTSLEGAPEQCGLFNCSNNQLRSFIGCPKEVMHLVVEDLRAVESLEGIATIIETHERDKMFGCHAKLNVKSLFDYYIRVINEIPVELRRVLSKEAVHKVVATKHPALEGMLFPNGMPPVNDDESNINNLSNFL